VKKSRNWKTYLIAHLGIVTALFVVLVISFLLRYVYKITDYTSSNTQQTMIDIIENYASDIEGPFVGGINVARVNAGYIENGNTKPMDYISSTKRLPYVENVYILDENGEGFDSQNNRVDFSGVDELFTVEVDMDHTGRIIKNTLDPENPALLCVVAAYTANKNKYYCVTQLTEKQYSNIFDAKEFDGLTVYLCVDSEGNVMFKNGGKSALSKSDNIWEVLEASSDEASRLKAIMSKGGTGCIEWNYQNESRQIVVTPIENTGLYLVAGVNNSFLKYKTNKDLADTHNFMTSIIVTVALYVVFMIAAMASYTFRYNRNSKQLEEKADTDLLTGINNKLATERKIKEYLETHPDVPCMVMLFDIDNFKKINDTKGHAFGDEVIRSVGQSIGGQFRVTDIVGRIGGDEFMIFLKNIPSEEIAVREAKKLMQYFKDFAVGGYVKYSATASVGVAMFPTDAKDFEGIYKAADEALYRSKENGRNQLNFYNKSVDTIRV